MRAVVQRVKEAWVQVENREVSRIEQGFLVLLGVGDEDTEKDVAYLADKVVNLRVFEDEEGKMNKSLIDVGGEMLIVSQFTLYGDCRKGRRPSFSHAATPDHAVPLYEAFCEKVKNYNITVKQGIFQAHMEVGLINDGPVTLLLDSKRVF
ncbi:D-tyrosyl-tRNA(Tyr) deacylase [Dissulfuribacter thermophilus]|uniref:D-aminoacyl-tRNA deacylase n=1 Tax=Dissulfuribacter thermophilus TaxID=1156395 RepID=A0A1B9F512_9BACT|nr:D-aminoacyl-tRNA deacylase [Dissulfuribacter thermophilus]OCC15020.1 D-tyrosyl-tRNA(Tyr) deacylase [Dissulfuribacter thermophilus]